MGRNQRDELVRVCDHHGVNLAETMAFWQAAADLIRADLEATTDLRWPLLIEAEKDGLFFNYGTSGNYLFPPPTEGELAQAIAEGAVPSAHTLVGMATAELADRVSEDVMEDLQRPWPECPVHHRPLEPTPVGPTGTWQCSQDRAHAAPIGGLAGMVDAAGVLSFT